MTGGKFTAHLLSFTCNTVVPTCNLSGRRQIKAILRLIEFEVFRRLWPGLRPRKDSFGLVVPPVSPGPDPYRLSFCLLLAAFKAARGKGYIIYKRSGCVWPPVMKYVP